MNYIHPISKQMAKPVCVMHKHRRLNHATHDLRFVGTFSVTAASSVHFFFSLYSPKSKLEKE